MLQGTDIVSAQGRINRKIDSYRPTDWNGYEVVKLAPEATPVPPQRLHCCLIPPHIQSKVADYWREHGDQEVAETWEARRKSGTRMRDTRTVFAISDKVSQSSASSSSSAAELAGVKVYNAMGTYGEGVFINPNDYDRDAERVHEYSEAVLKFLKDIVGRNSVDNMGMTLVNRIHVGDDLDNAFWNGYEMSYGDGDETKSNGHNIFRCFTTDIDVGGHELGHGVVQYEANFDYQGESGALNEHWADVLGQCLLQWKNGDTVDKASWLVGANLIYPIDGKDYALRSLAQPGSAYVDHPVLGTDPQPAYMSDFVKTKEDNGGVHINSGIPNHAFYLFATALGGNSWSVAFPTWYDALCALKDQTKCSFSEFARATLDAAEKREEDVYRACLAAWKAVGVDPDEVLASSSDTPDDASSCVLL